MSKLAAIILTNGNLHEYCQYLQEKKFALPPFYIIHQYYSYFLLPQEHTQHRFKLLLMHGCVALGLMVAITGRIHRLFSVQAFYALLYSPRLTIHNTIGIRQLLSFCAVKAVLHALAVLRGAKTPNRHKDRSARRVSIFIEKNELPIFCGNVPRHRYLGIGKHSITMPT